MSDQSKTKTKQKLERALFIPASAEMFERDADHKTEYFTTTYEIVIGIGKDHTAKLIVDHESYLAYLKGAKLIF